MQQPQPQKGFSLIELMIVVAIVAILAAIAIPSYRDYVIRGQLVNATTALGGSRAKMEQYYQDNRTYAISGTFTPPCSTAYNSGMFTVSCVTAPTANGYTVTAQGIAGSSVAAFAYSIDQSNTQLTTALPATWGTAPPSQPCWILKRRATC